MPLLGGATLNAGLPVQVRAAAWPQFIGTRVVTESDIGGESLAESTRMTRVPMTVAPRHSPRAAQCSLLERWRGRDVAQSGSVARKRRRNPRMQSYEMRASARRRGSVSVLVIPADGQGEQLHGTRTQWFSSGRRMKDAEAEAEACGHCGVREDRATARTPALTPNAAAKVCPPVSGK